MTDEACTREPCDWCGRPMNRAASDECVNPEHRATDQTLGIRDGSCGCCVIVDATALELLREMTTTTAAHRDGHETTNDQRSA